MKEQTIKFKTRKTHRVCIHLSPIHFDFLKELATTRFQGDISKTVLYLLSKYLKYLYKIKNIDKKRTMTIDYQPQTKQYKRYWISINPIYWGNLYNLRFSLGYSMSFLLRIMLDWEMEESHEPQTNIIIPKPQLHPQPASTTYLLHNYAQKVWLYHPSRWVYLRMSGVYQAVG